VLPESSSTAERAHAPNLIPIPLVVVVGCTPWFLDRARRAGHRLRVLVRACDAFRLAATVEALRPDALLVAEDLYALAPKAFEGMAREAPLEIVRLSHEDLSPVEMELTLAFALRRA
jgi:hypothetical protein